MNSLYTIRLRLKSSTYFKQDLPLMPYNTRVVSMEGTLCRRYLLLVLNDKQ